MLVKVLDSSIKVIAENRKDGLSSSFGIFVKTGSRNEDKSVYGISHFLEHILFKSSSKYTQLEISQKIENVGGTLNAATTHEYTYYFFTVPSVHLLSLVDVFIDFVLFPTFNLDYVNQEREIIFQEMKMYLDNPQAHVYDILYETMFKGEDLRHSIIGSEQSLRNITVDSLNRYYNERYINENIVISIVGRENEEELVNYVNELTSSRKPNLEHISRSYITNESINSSVGIKYYNSEQTNVILSSSFQTDTPHSIKYELQLLNDLIGSGMSSLLFQRIREELSLVYHISGSIDTMSDRIIYMIYFGCNNDKYKFAIDETLKLIRTSILDKLGDDLYQILLKKTVGTFLMNQDGSLNRMVHMGYYGLFNTDYLSISSVINKLNSISLNDLKDRCAHLIDLFTNNLNIAATGPLKKDSIKLT